jgi:hypothetical protein
MPNAEDSLRIRTENAFPRLTKYFPDTITRVLKNAKTNRPGKRGCRAGSPDDQVPG